jgi:PAS domain S-box-containing protein
MNLRSKLLLGIGIALIVTFSLVAVFSYLTMEQSYRTLENQQVQRAVESSVNILNTDMKNTYSVSRDYAVWSETYRFAQGQNPDWIDQNMADDFFIRFGIDYVLVFNRSDQFVYGKGYNFSSSMTEPVPLSLVGTMRDLNSSGNNTSTTGTYGIVNNPDGLFMVASHPVLQDNFQGPAVGSLCVVRRIDSTYLADLGARAGYTVTLIPSQEIMRNQSLAGMVSSLTPDSPVAIIPENEDAIAGYTHIADLQNTGGLYVKVAEPRTIYHAGITTIVTFLKGLLVAGIFIILFVLLFIDRVVLSRLNAIISTVREKKEAGDNTRADGDTGKDELALLALEIDPVLGRLAESRIELKESEERYSALFSNNYSVSLLIDPDTGRIVDANEAAVRYYGYSHDQLTNMGIYDLNRLPGDKVVRNLKRAKDEKEKHFFSTHYRADGEKRYVEVYSGPITVQGKPLFYSIIHDITDRKLAEQALRESEERYRTLIDQLPDYVIVHREGILLYVNPAAALQFGYTTDMLTGKPILLFIAPEYHDTVRKAITERMAGKDVPPYEMKIRAKDGTFRTVLTNGSVITFGGRPASLNVLSDITDRKFMEEEVRSLNRVLEQRVQERTEALSRANEQLKAEITARTNAEQEIIRSLEEKELLLREIHHRVKNNLQIIASLLKLQSRFITDPNVLESIKDSQSRVRAMALVHERIYRSHNIVEINLKEYLIYLTKQIFQFYNIQNYQIGITVTMGDIMADIDTVVPVGLIMNELVSNSLKHAFPDGRKGSISIECTPQDADMLRIVYHDNGTGMPARFDWKNTESLGLRLVNSLVDQLNGTIDAGAGEGTTFIITIQHKRESAQS